MYRLLSFCEMTKNETGEMSPAGVTRSLLRQHPHLGKLSH